MRRAALYDRLYWWATGALLTGIGAGVWWAWLGGLLVCGGILVLEGLHAWRRARAVRQREHGGQG